MAAQSRPRRGSASRPRGGPAARARASRRRASCGLVAKGVSGARPTCWWCRCTKRSGLAGTRWGGYAALAEADWQRLRAGPGRKGARGYDGQCRVPAEAADADRGHCLLFRRACAQPQQWPAYLVWGPQLATCPPWSGLPAACRLSDGPAAWPGADRARNPAAVAASAAARDRGPRAGAGLVRLAPPAPVGGLCCHYRRRPATTL